MKRSPFLVLSIIALFWLWPQWGVALEDNPFGERTVKEALESPDQTPSQSPSSGTTEQQSAPSQSGGILRALLNMVAALSLVLALIYMFYRIFFRRQRFLREVGGIRYLGGFPLGAQKSLQLVEIAGKVYVLGVAEEVQLLRLIDDPDEKEILLANVAQLETASFPSTEIARRFSAQLARLKEQRRKWFHRHLMRKDSSGDGEGR